MFVLVTGGSGSGKSEYAESLLCEMGDNPAGRYYIATMIPFGEEGKQRVKRHQKQREGRYFKTAECYRDLDRLELPGSCDVLLECMSNLLANEMFDVGGDACARILQGVEHLIKQCRHVVIVTNEVFSDGNIYDESTQQYICLLGQINQKLAQMADDVTEVVYSVPVYHKRKGNAGTAENDD